MKKLDFNEGWFYSHIDREEYIPVTLPHDAMFCEPRTAQSAGGVNTGWFEGHDYIYVKKFARPAEPVVWLELEGVYRNSEVWLNGEQLSFRPHGYMPVWVELTAGLTDGENTLKVVARNADQPNSRWYSGAGMYRPAWLHVAPGAYIKPEGVRVTTQSISPAVVRVDVAASEEGSWTAEIYEGGRLVGSCNDKDNTVAVKDAKLWSEDTPCLYTCLVKFGDDSLAVNFGIRQIECDSEGGFRINGKRVVLRGACVHHDNGPLGACAYTFAEERKVKQLKEAGFNAVRCAHNPCSKAFLDACDKYGLLVMDEFSDMWYIHKTKYDYASYFDKWWKTDIGDMIARDFNHPSVVMYSIGNEVSETAQPRGIALSREMTKFCHEHDGTRPVTCGVNIFFNFLSSIGFGVYSDKKEEKQESPDGKKEKKKAVGSEFFNNLAGIFGTFPMKYGATLRGSNLKTRDAFAQFDIAGYNYGIMRCKRDLRLYPKRVIVGSEVFCEDVCAYTNYANAHPAIIGSFVWTGYDYLGEVALGAVEYREYAPAFDKSVGWLTASCGSLDITGKATAEMAYLRVAYGLSPIELGVIPFSTDGNDSHSHSAWRMTPAKQSWSWEGCEGRKTKVEVYAAGTYAELFLNGKSLGKKKVKPNKRRVSFKVKYAPGELTAASYDAYGKEIARTSLKSAGRQTVLTLSPESAEVPADGLVYVRVKYTDEGGTVKVTKRGDISLKVEGGKLMGFGSACPHNARGFLTDVSDTYYGEALAVIKPLADEVKISVSDGTYVATAAIKTNRNNI